MYLHFKLLSLYRLTYVIQQKITKVHLHWVTIQNITCLKKYFPYLKFTCKKIHIYKLYSFLTVMKFKNIYSQYQKPRIKTHFSVYSASAIFMENALKKVRTLTQAQFWNKHQSFYYQKLLLHFECQTSTISFHEQKATGWSFAKWYLIPLPTFSTTTSSYPNHSACTIIHNASCRFGLLCTYKKTSKCLHNKYIKQKLYKYII